MRSAWLLKSLILLGPVANLTASRPRTFDISGMEVMSNLVSVRRVTVVAEAGLEKMLLDQFIRLGAKGYTCASCRGRGEHEIYEDPLHGAGRVRIETIVQPKVADDIMNYLKAAPFAARAVMACVETVDVFPEERV